MEGCERTVHPYCSDLGDSAVDYAFYRLRPNLFESLHGERTSVRPPHDHSAQNSLHQHWEVTVDEEIQTLLDQDIS